MSSMKQSSGGNGLISYGGLFVVRSLAELLAALKVDWLFRFLFSSIGKKLLMALTGLGSMALANSVRNLLSITWLLHRRRRRFDRLAL